MASGKKDKAKGAASQTVGKLKEAAGKVTGSGKTEAKGKAQQAKGGMQKGVGHLRENQKKQR
ncbi:MULTISPECIES: CsbD family protein [Halomonadaceae]|uniref:CsbD family protein n=1 Tax=Halomonadaceae TaxID=28256 RepID=UPI0009ECD6B1|nr:MULTISPECIES: CsbD family protein [Halomonas]MCO7245724.1 CsbD family protein [Halomonas sp. Mc5H-6]MCW4148726.1 CsbD family protein [Halomonas sp. 18H]MCZ0930427.1 CsbD family protein [Halomonas janggokensis]MDR5884766.1 CsbD family protein [Halomonas janggokensis]QPL45210.1 CsbD family protein [Halomonas sp. A40-4]